LRFYARLSGVPASLQDDRIDKLLSWVGLSHSANARLKTYSKGMLQRVGIAQALIHDPKVVFMDEPMSGIDPIGRKEIRDLILRLRDDGKTVFMNTHILSDVEMICDRIAIIVGGEIRYHGRIDEFLVEDDRTSDVLISGIGPSDLESLEAKYGKVRQGIGERLEFRVKEKEVNSILNEVIHYGAEVTSVAPHRRSLESFFMDTVTGGKRK
jgi:ABC-2 type transport system ATP-binding protein